MPSYTQYKRFMACLDEDDDIETWITVRGNHIPIRKGQTKAEAVTAFIDSKRNSQNDGLIRPGHPDFGKPGRYEVFRSGDLSAPNGTIFTTPDVEHAREYADTDDDKVDTYNVNIKNPLVIEGESDVDILKKTYKKLFGRDFGDKILDSITWPKYDAMISRRLSKSKHDALITISGGRGREIQIPKSKGLVLHPMHSFKRSELSWDPEDSDYKEASNVESKMREDYAKFVNTPLEGMTQEEGNALGEKMRKEGLEQARFIKALRKLMVYETYGKLTDRPEDKK